MPKPVDVHLAVRLYRTMSFAEVAKELHVTGAKLHRVFDLNDIRRRTPEENRKLRREIEKTRTSICGGDR